MRTNRGLASLSDLTPAAAGEATKFLAQGGQLLDPTIHFLNLSQKEMVEVNTWGVSSVPDAEDLPDLAEGEAQAFGLDDEAEASDGIRRVDSIPALGAV
jgi:hypothetical protein